MATFGGVCFLDFFIRAPEVPFLIPPKRPKRAFWGYKKWHLQCPNKKIQENRPPPNVAILGPNEILGRVSEIGKYFLG